MKFYVLARFREMIPTMKSISSSEIQRINSGFLTEITILPFFQKLEFLGSYMYHDLHRQYYWSGMKRHVGDIVRRCLTCQQVKDEHQRPVGLLHPLGVLKWKWEHITMNFLTHLPRTSWKHDAEWVIVDRLTKSAHFLAVRMTFTLEEFCRI